MASGADPAEPLKPERIDDSAPAAAAAAAGEPATGADTAGLAAVQPQQLIPDQSPIIEDPPLPPVLLPVIETNSINPVAPPLTATGSSSPGPASYATVAFTPAACSDAACSGFRTTNRRGTAGGTNRVHLIPAENETEVDPWSDRLYEIARLRLTNGGLIAPADAKMITVPITTKVTVRTPKLNTPSIITLRFNVMWSPGGPAPANQAGLFVLSTRGQRSSADFNLSMSPFTVFDMNIQVVGFTANPKSPSGADVEVLGGWGQPKPAQGEPGPRVYVPRGKTQVVKLMVRLCKSDSLSPGCKKPQSAASG